MKLIRALLCAVLATAGTTYAIDFDEHFCDKTLRLDYIFSGNAGNNTITLAEVSSTDGWAGRRVNLDSMPITGDGNVTVTTLTGDTIYRMPFSTLFSEWVQLTDSVPRAFENSYLIPCPKEPVVVTTTLNNARHQPIASHTMTLDPADILIVPRNYPPLPHKYIHQGASPKEAIDVAILAEGYTEDEMETFYADASRAVNAILRHEPFKSYADSFNFVAVASPSIDSGVSIPKDNNWRRTPFGSHFSTFYSDRYLTCPHTFALHNALAGIPYEHIIVLANTDEYGGGGIFNSYTLTAAHTQLFEPVVVHEFGHSFGGLADEYFYEDEENSDTYPTDIEPWEQNVTTLVDFGSKWQHKLAEGTPIPTPVDDAEKYPVGVYEGAAYSTHGLYRPANECRMRNNTVPAFCPVCIDALTRIIDFYTK